MQLSAKTPTTGANGGGGGHFRESLYTHDTRPRRDYSTLMQPVALRLLGDPNTRMSNGTEWRFGTHGSVSVDLEAGTFFDHERGKGGGVLDLVKWKAPTSNRREAMRWLDQQGLTPETVTTPPPRAEDRDSERAKAAAIAAQKAVSRWSRADPADPEHPYLKRKQIRPHCARQNKVGELVLPVTKVEGDLVSVQTIGTDGGKQFLPGGRKKGCMILITDPPGASRTVVVEGFATGATIAEAYPEARVVAALDAGNLPLVVKALREQFPGTDIVVGADHDPAGIKAAKAAGCRYALPPTPGHDWNDHAVAGGVVDLGPAPAEAVTPEPDASQGDADDVGAEIERLAGLHPVEYDKARKEAAKRLGITLKTLDREVGALRQEAEEDATSPVEELEAWQQPVDGLAVLSEMEGILRAYCILQDSDYRVLPVLALATYCIDAFSVFPRGVIKSPQKRCGKTVLLETLESLTHRALMASGISTAAMFRVIDRYSPTLLIDEADTFMQENEELRGVINSSHRRRNASVIRTVGDNHEPTKFSTWAPMFIAGIGDRAETVEDRAIIFELRRKLPNESVARCPPDMYERNANLRRKCIRWAQDNIDTLRTTDFEVPSFGNDRAADNWLPLFAIARLVGGEWEQHLMDAFRIKSHLEAENEPPAVLLLRDIRQVFDERGDDRIHSETLIQDLVELPGQPWAEWKHGKPMTPASLSRLLKPFKIRPKQIRIGAVNRHGYERDQFRDAWTRYLNVSRPVPRNQTATTLQRPKNNDLDDFKPLQTEVECSGLNGRKSLIIGGCSGVALSNGGSGEKEKNDLDSAEPCGNSNDSDSDWEVF